MIFKNYLFYLMVLCGSSMLVHDLDAKSCGTSCSKKKCSVAPSLAFPCAPQTTDFIIVGLGASGGTAARFISDPIDGEYINSVVVLEAGQNYGQLPEVLNPSAEASEELAGDPKFSNTYVVNPGDQANFGFNFLSYTVGRMWGGGSGHNDMQSVRGTPPLWDDWALASGVLGWAYNNILPLMKYIETYKDNGGGIDLTYRGVQGAMGITQDDYNPVATNPFIVNTMSTLASTPLPIIGDYNIPAGQLGISPFQQNNTNGQFTPGSVRTFSVNAFLPTVADNPTDPIITPEGIGLNGRKLQIISRATVTRVIFEGNNAVGVEYILNEDTEQVFIMYARKEVILCAGSIADVAILQRSGIGPQAVLDPLGIPAIVYNDNVGANLKNHYGASCVMTATTNPDNVALFGLTAFFSDAAPYFTGTPGRRRIEGFFGGGPFFFTDQAILVALEGPQILDPLAFPTNSFAFLNLAPKATGSVVIPDTDPLTIPNVNFGFYDDYNPSTDPLSDYPGSDYELMVSMFKIIRDMAHSCGESMVYPTEAMFAAADAGDPSQLIFAAQYGTFIAYHAACTCRMALSAANGVVNGELKVFGVNNLRIADCSIMPLINDGNTAVPAYYIGAALGKLLGSQALPNIFS